MKAKLMSLTAVLVLLFLGLFQISTIVADRRLNRDVAVQSVVQSVAGSQTLIGPMLTRSCTEEWSTTSPRGGVTVQRQKQSTLLAPATLKVTGDAQLETRSRGLHPTQMFVYQGRVTAEWAYDPAMRPAAPLHSGGVVSCEAVLSLPVSDARGIRRASLQVAGAPVLLRPGTALGKDQAGVSGTVTLPATGPLKAEFELELIGTERLTFVPVGDDTRVSLASNWPHPSFGGQFLPATRAVTDKGFDASWQVTSLAQQGSGCHARIGLPAIEVATAATVGTPDAGDDRQCADGFSIDFIDPVNIYVLSDRATKYGLLFIGLTFLAVGLFEVLKSLRVHPVQYFLVGAAMSMFFLLLVSLSEHLSFAIAYAVASAACVLLLTIYASYMLRRWSLGLPFGLGIAVLYGLLYVLLQLEQTALLVGAVALFAMLGAFMLATRNVDWYAMLKMPSREPGRPTPAVGPGANAGL